MTKVQVLGVIETQKQDFTRKPDNLASDPHIAMLESNVCLSINRSINQPQQHSAKHVQEYKT